MELKEFIKKSLIEVCEGVMEARAEMVTRINNCPIAPAIVNGTDDNEVWKQLIEFDVRVIISSEGQLTASAGSSAILMKGEGTSKEKSEFTQNIKFAIPFYPAALVRGT